MSKTAKPFLKWAGGKGQILDEIRRRYPAELGRSITKYAEPFVGGGAVLFDVLNNHKPCEVYISDINRELVLTYKIVQTSVNDLIEELTRIENAYISVNDEQRKSMYYSNRERFNALKLNKSDSLELAALLIFLNRTCFNGLYRVNRKGEYNVPQGSYKKPTICDEDNLRAVSEMLQGVNIFCGDYRLARDFIDERTFAYFDPPYRPLNMTSNFTAYACDNFGDEQQIELARFIDEMTERGAWCVASNSDPTNVDESDKFFDDLYSKHRIERIYAARAINSAGASRGNVREVLVARR